MRWSSGSKSSKYATSIFSQIARPKALLAWTVPLDCARVAPWKSGRIYTLFRIPFGFTNTAGFHPVGKGVYFGT